MRIFDKKRKLKKFRKFKLNTKQHTLYTAHDCINSFMFSLMEIDSTGNTISYYNLLLL